MNIEAYMKQFDVNFSKLKSNREKVPLEQLQTKYAKAYNALVAAIEAYARWFTEEYINTLAIGEMPGDDSGIAWLHKKIATIRAEEKKSGGLERQIRDALIVDLDNDKFMDRVYRLHERLQNEAYNPYQQRFNRRLESTTGPDGKPWIYNSLFEAWWLPNPKYEEGGYWIDKDYNFKRMGYPPKITTAPEVKDDAGQ